MFCVCTRVPVPSSPVSVRLRLCTTRGLTLSSTGAEQVQQILGPLEAGDGIGNALRARLGVVPLQLVPNDVGVDHRLLEPLEDPDGGAGQHRGQRARLRARRLATRGVLDGKTHRRARA